MKRSQKSQERDFGLGLFQGRRSPTKRFSFLVFCLLATLPCGSAGSTSTVIWGENSGKAPKRDPQPAPSFHSPAAPQHPQETKEPKVEETPIVLASLWRRFAADVLTHFMLILVMFVLAGIIIIPDDIFDDDGNVIPFWSQWGLGIKIIFVIFYFLRVFSVSRKLLGIEVVDKSGEKASFLQHLLRALIRSGVGCFTPIPVGALLDYVLPWLTKYQQGFADICAGTIVVKRG